MTAFAVTSAARLALTMVAHEVGPARRSNQSAVVKQWHDQFAGRQRGGGSINGANLAGGIGGFGFGLGDGGGELGLGEVHGSCPFVMSNCKIMIAPTVNVVKIILAVSTRIYLD